MPTFTDATDGTSMSAVVAKATALSQITSKYWSLRLFSRVFHVASTILAQEPKSIVEVCRAKDKEFVTPSKSLETQNKCNFKCFKLQQ